MIKRALTICFGMALAGCSSNPSSFSSSSSSFSSVSPLPVKYKIGNKGNFNPAYTGPYVPISSDRKLGFEPNTPNSLPPLRLHPDQTKALGPNKNCERYVYVIVPSSDLGKEINAQYCVRDKFTRDA